MDPRRVAVAACVTVGLVACAPAPVGRRPPASTPSPSGSPSSPSPLPSPSPSPLPAYYIESLRALSHAPGTVTVGRRLDRGNGFTRYEITWSSQGQAMTGTMAMPDGAGPFPVVIANHGYLPASQYTPGVDAWKYGDPLSSAGFISIAPSYPGYGGSGLLDPVYPSIVAEAVADIDLVSSLASIPHADPARVAMIGHSNGGGVALLVAVTDPRVKVFVLFAPVSSDMADNYRKFWSRSGHYPSLPSPDAAPDVYAHISPRNYFAAGMAPILLLQGTADAEIPRQWTEATLQALRDAQVTTDVTWYAGATHAFYTSVLAQANARAAAWIRRYLP